MFLIVVVYDVKSLKNKALQREVGRGRVLLRSVFPLFMS